MRSSRRFLLLSLAVALLCGGVAFAGGKDPLVRGEVLRILNQLGITSGGVYTPPAASSLAAVLAVGADGNSVDQTNLGSLTTAAGKTVSSPTVTATTAVVLGAATTAGVRLDLESGDLAVREGDDSAYANARALALMVGSTQDVGLARLSAGIVKVTDGSTGLGKLQTADGTAALPAITGTDLDTGIYFGADTVYFAAGGAVKFHVQAGEIRNYTTLKGNGNVGTGFTDLINAQTVDANPSAAASWGIYTNEGASGEVIIILPAAASGYRYRCIVEAAQYLRVKANTGDLIRGTRNANVVAGTVESSALAGYWRSNVPGAWIEVVAINATTWQVVGIGGTWTIDS